jgi:hypothetical protein
VLRSSTDPFGESEPVVIVLKEPGEKQPATPAARNRARATQRSVDTKEDVLMRLVR